MKLYKKNIAILGSTGSIGTQALEVVSGLNKYFNVCVITTNNNADLVIKQAVKFLPDYVIINNPKKYSYVKKSLLKYNVKVLCGEKEICNIMSLKKLDLVLIAIVGISGLLPTLAAIKAKKQIALANKESLVVGGHLIMSLSKKNNVKIIPVDSEHSAIFQCLQGETKSSVKKITLTASGGPFRGFNVKKLKNVSVKDALSHPNWKMGKKITIDSASLMNKALEIIEAKWLFNLDYNQIDFIIHPQSVIHSFVEFKDSSIIAQLGLPDMKLPIQYALTYPKRVSNNLRSIDFFDVSKLSFEKINTNVFRSLQMVYEVIKKGGNTPCIFNSANEVAVSMFLKNKINFLDIYKIIVLCLENITFVQNPSLDSLLATDFETKNFIKKIK